MILGALAAATLVASAAGAQDRRNSRDDRNNGDRETKRDAFQWTGELARGQRLYLYNINGNVTVESTRGNKVEISADKSWRKSRPEDVEIEARRTRGDRDVVVCAIWKDRNLECDEDGYRSRNHDGWNNGSNDVQVNFTVRLPAGAHITANTMNGDLEVTGASGDVRAMTINGRVDAESSDGTVEAKTVNGNIHVRMARMPSRGVSYETVTGSVTVELPAGLDADLNAQTVTGGITSDFPISVGGSGSRRDGFSSHRLNGTIGRGGPRLELKTVTGPIHLEKSGSSNSRAR
jgi:DUF4097 and DUF4098 domain-containing protein YvlB